MGLDRSHADVVAGWRSADAMGQWLDSLGGWDAFATLTFGPKFGDTGPSPDRAMYHFRKWYRDMGRARPRPAFVAVEKGSAGGRVHLHGLFGPLGSGVPRKAAWRSWFDRYGRAQILPFDPTLGAPYYVAKYVSKEPLHWDIFT